MMLFVSRRGYILYTYSSLHVDIATRRIMFFFYCRRPQGDSGGPLMIEKDNGRWTLVGTVSHGIKCAAPYLPGVYMRTTYYKPWLQTITGVQ